MHAVPLNCTLEGSYYDAEVKAVAQRYFDLQGAGRDDFVERRLAYIKAMKEVVFRVLLLYLRT